MKRATRAPRSLQLDHLLKFRNGMPYRSFIPAYHRMTLPMTPRTVPLQLHIDCRDIVSSNCSNPAGRVAEIQHHYPSHPYSTFSR